MLAVAAATGTTPRAPLRAGLAAGAAIVVRPNLVPLGVPIGLFLLLRPERTWAERARAAGVYAAGCAAGCAAVAAIQQAYYGSPFTSGYGPLDTLFAAAHVGPNAERYFTWMAGAHTPVWLLAAAAPLLLPGALTLLLTAMIAITLACYLPYVVFDDWTFLRFLLPAVPLVLVLTVAVVDAVCRRVSRSPRVAAAAVAALALALAPYLLSEAASRQVFRLHALEAKFARAGAYVAAALPPNALVITNWESGSVRFYSGRRTLVWDSLDPAWLDRAIAYARGRGLEPVLLFETWEEPRFRQRFAGSALAALDWPPAAEVAGQVRIYRPEDRDRYRQGLDVVTVYAR
jgi:hypothetical protein